MRKAFHRELPFNASQLAKRRVGEESNVESSYHEKRATDTGTDR